MSDEEHLKTAICMNYGGLEMILTGVREYSSCMLYGMKRQSAPTVILGSPKWTTDTMRFTRFIPIIRNFSRFRRLRNKSTHSFASVDSRAAARVVNELESLIMCLLADSDFWFDSNPVPAELLNIMEDESWFRDEKVSPISFSKAQQLISFAVSSGVQPQIDIAVRHTASIF
jgi:predicted trehalose synthase